MLPCSGEHGPTMGTTLMKVCVIMQEANSTTLTKPSERRGRWSHGGIPKSLGSCPRGSQPSLGHSQAPWDIRMYYPRAQVITSTDHIFSTGWVLCFKCFKCTNLFNSHNHLEIDYNFFYFFTVILRCHSHTSQHLKYTLQWLFFVVAQLLNCV